jgi:tryptophan halogenase
MSAVDAWVKRVVIVGGGTAGWLTAAVLAAKLRNEHALSITVLESPDISPIGVGEGTWPSIRDTLRGIGVSESDFIRECGATFKQGSRFVNWRVSEGADAYMHPFVLPQGYLEANLVAGWLQSPEVPYADLVSFQPHLCAAGAGPKQFSTPEYAAVANYAYHLDAGKFGLFLRKHCVERLGVRHMADHMLEVHDHENGDIASVQTREHGALEGDLFIDCTGSRSLLLGKHYGIDQIDVHDVLFNDRAVAVQAPYAEPDTPIACQTISTARKHGWVWDIGLSARRGIGYVYSSAHTTQEEAETTLHDYIRSTGGPAAQDLPSPIRIAFEPGYRRVSWHRNCVAIGLSSGFVEPLEASSMALVEMGVNTLADQFPATRDDMDRVARRYNDAFGYRWQRVVDFLKLHYVFSEREDSQYWRDQRAESSIPDSLKDLLHTWRYRPPSRHQLVRVEEIFPSASYHYVLYGMGFRPQLRSGGHAENLERATGYFREATRLGKQMLQALPSHRALIDHVTTRGLPKI